MRSLSREEEVPALESRLLLPKTIADSREDIKKYRRRRFSLFSSSSSSGESRISLVELICVFGAFIVLTCYASRSWSTSPSSSVAPQGAPRTYIGAQRPPSFSRSRTTGERSGSSAFISPSSSALAARSSQAVLSEQVKKGAPRIAAAITTSKRPELFRRAYLSFRLRCLDCDAAISQWFAVDDGSSDAQLEAMQAVSSDITWLRKDGPQNETTGHVSSLNRVLREVIDDYDYLVFLEDDFFFLQDEDYISKALNIFTKNESIGQIVFNRRYSLTNTEIEDRDQVGGIEVRDPATGNVTHIMHLYVGPAGSPEWKAYFEKHPGIGSVHWPHFSLNSGMWKLKALKDVGPFEKRDGFEFFYGLRWMEKGYVTAFFPGKYSIHLGKPLPNSAISSEVLDAMFAGQGLRHSVAHTASAYDLNGVIR
jgi:GT2 family glycosyltransferase